MKIGGGWTKSTEDGKTTIGLQIDDSIQELFPPLKSLRFSLKYLSQEERGTNENAPHWALSMYKPTQQRQNNQKAEEANAQIIAEANASAQQGETVTTERIPF